MLNRVIVIGFAIIFMGAAAFGFLVSGRPSTLDKNLQLLSSMSDEEALHKKDAVARIEGASGAQSDQARIARAWEGELGRCRRSFVASTGGMMAGARGTIQLNPEWVTPLGRFDASSRVLEPQSITNLFKQVEEECAGATLNRVDMVSRASADALLAVAIELETSIPETYRTRDLPGVAVLPATTTQVEQLIAAQ